MRRLTGAAALGLLQVHALSAQTVAPTDFIDRVILRTSVAPDGRGGGVVAWSLPTP